MNVSNFRLICCDGNYNHGIFFQQLNKLIQFIYDN